MAVGLVRTSNNQVIGVYQKQDIRIELPDGLGQVSPLVVGWTGSGFTIASVIPDTVPEGQWPSGPATYTYAAGVITENIPTIAIPQAVINERNRVASFSANTQVVTLLNQLKTASDSQIDTWMTNNVTDLASARRVLSIIAKIIALALKRGFV